MNRPPSSTLSSEWERSPRMAANGKQPSFTEGHQTVSLRSMPNRSPETSAEDWGLDDASISQLRQFFELLDRWDREATKPM
ncbi:MAG TPA: hypothetical protein VN577_08260 [Terriglobales bacterium]|nr:hypothetical protein [Terriglobales bacterium]